MAANKRNAEPSLKANLVMATTTAQVVMEKCCKKCRLNNILLYAQAIVNIILIALVVILFVMISNMKTDYLLLRNELFMRPSRDYRATGDEQTGSSSSSSQLKPHAQKLTQYLDDEQMDVNPRLVNISRSKFISRSTSVGGKKASDLNKRRNVTSELYVPTAAPTETTTVHPTTAYKSFQAFDGSLRPEVTS